MAPTFQVVIQAATAFASVAAARPRAGSHHGQPRGVQVPSQGQLLLQVSTNAQLNTGEMPIAHGGGDVGFQRTSLAETLHLAKDAARSALGTAGRAGRNVTQATWAQSMMEDINTDIVPGIAADHNVDQQRLDSTAEKIHNCVSNVLETNQTEMAPLVTAIAKEKMELDTQLGVLQDLNETSTVLCNSTQSFLSSHTCVLPMQLHPDVLASYMDCVEKWLAESQSLHKKCDEAHANTTKHEQYVKDLQQNHTLRKCSLANLRENACETYTACRDEHDADYAQIKEEVVKSASGREHEVQALMKITCFLEVVVMSPEELATAAGETKLASCENVGLMNATLNLSFDFPSIPQATGCPLKEVETTGCVMPTAAPEPTPAPTPTPTPAPTEDGQN